MKERRGCESCEEVEMRAFSLAGRMLGTHGWDPGLESPRLPGVEGSEGSRAMSMGQPAEGLWGGVCVQ